ncbi:hypothetical protein QE152_g6735 [Popillia japonica]|uniref:Uncharacterized protein n=1 Tax=Popillia japonica TaxID=7064 RepID=A0AAW1MJ67_POPJA
MMKYFWNDEGWEKIIVTDEAHLHLDTYVNKQNCWYGAPTNSHETHGMQDGATANTTQVSIATVSELLPGRRLSQHGDTATPIGVP